MGKPNKLFFRCSICGKLLIERLPNGLWHFVFGKRPDEKGDFIFPVEMMIHGSVRMRCLRRSCRVKHPEHWNTLNFFPGVVVEEGNRSEDRKNSIGDEKASGEIVVSSEIAAN
jgi:hypothetical protein